MWGYCGGETFLLIWAQRFVGLASQPSQPSAMARVRGKFAKRTFARMATFLHGVIYGFLAAAP